MNSFEYWIECHWKMFFRIKKDCEWALVQVINWCHQASSHYLKWCSPRTMAPYILNELKVLFGIPYIWGNSIHFPLQIYFSWKWYIILPPDQGGERYKQRDKSRKMQCLRYDIQETLPRVQTPATPSLSSVKQSSQAWNRLNNWS